MGNCFAQRRFWKQSQIEPHFPQMTPPLSRRFDRTAPPKRGALDGSVLTEHSDRREIPARGERLRFASSATKTVCPKTRWRPYCDQKITINGILCRNTLFDGAKMNPLARHINASLETFLSTSGELMWAGAIKDMNLKKGAARPPSKWWRCKDPGITWPHHY